MQVFNYSGRFLREPVVKALQAFAITTCVILNQGCQNNNAESRNSAKEVISLRTSESIKVDAQLNERDWHNASIITIYDDSLRSENQVAFRTLWDDQNLYMAFQVRDKNLQSKQTILDHPQLSKDDIVEFLIDVKNDKDSCWTTDDVIYHINLLNQKKDDRGTVDCKSDSKWNGTAKSKVRLLGTLNDSTDIDSGYTVEIALAWKELDVQPFTGFEAGFNFANADSGIFFDWAGAWPFRSPYAFGNLVLKEN